MYKFCRPLCKDRFERDIRDGTIMNTASLLIMNKTHCVHCFDELKPKARIEPNKIVKATLGFA